MIRTTLGLLFLALVLTACAATTSYGPNRSLTLRELLPLAEKGDASAQNNLGIMYEEGQGVAQNYAEAVRWYRKAADQGHPLGQNSLGFMYEKGFGVAQNYSEAMRWYRKAADQGEPGASASHSHFCKRPYGASRSYTLTSR